MPSNEIFSKLLKKSFDILDETSKNSRRIPHNDIEDLLELVRDRKKTVNKQRAEKLFGAAQASQRGSSGLRKSDADDLRHYRDPFFSPPKPKDTSFKKVKLKIQHSTEDYGEQQRQRHKKESHRMLLYMSILAIGLVAIAVGLNT